MKKIFVLIVTILLLCVVTFSGCQKEEEPPVLSGENVTISVYGRDGKMMIFFYGKSVSYTVEVKDGVNILTVKYNGKTYYFVNTLFQIEKDDEGEV